VAFVAPAPYGPPKEYSSWRVWRRVREDRYRTWSRARILRDWNQKATFGRAGLSLLASRPNEYVVPSRQEVY
jgi:hypothetical protein